MADLIINDRHADLIRPLDYMNKERLLMELSKFKSNRSNFIVLSLDLLSCSVLHCFETGYSSGCFGRLES